MKKNLKQTAKIKSNILILTFAVALLSPKISKAQTPDQNIINQQDWITRQQQNKIEEEKRLKEQEAIKKERNLEKKEEEEISKQKPDISDKSIKCIPIKEIRFIHANSLSKKERNNLIKPFLDKCFNNQVLAELISSINSYYKKKGYGAVQVNIPKQNIGSGVLEIKIYEGKIEKIIIGEDRFVDKMQAMTAFGNIQGDVLNLNDINQGLYQINRLPSNTAQMRITPGSEDGEAIVAIDNNKKFPARANIGYDNLGNDFTGIRRTNFSGGIDNLLFLNDAINLNYSTNLNDNNQTKDIKSFSSAISIPFGYNTFSYDYSRSEFRGTYHGINNPLILTGYSQRNNATIDRVLYNKNNLRISANTSLTTKSSASYLNQEKYDTSERKLTIGNIGFSISNYFENGTNLYLKPTYYKGLKLLNAKKDEDNIAADVAKAQFDYFKLYAALSKKFNIPKLEVPIVLSTEMDSQYSKQTLFGTEQFAVGGYYSVRGFRENYITGDSGYYFRNKAGFNLGSIILPLLSKENSGYFSYLNQLSMEPFYDYGYTRIKHSGQGNLSSGRLSGAGIKTIFGSKYFNASLTYSWAINKSKLITSQEKENKMVYFELGMGI